MIKSMNLFRHEIVNGSSADDNLGHKHLSLLEDLSVWREEQKKFMPSVQPCIESIGTDSRLETVCLMLPSDFTASQRAELNLVEAGRLEYLLREGDAHDMLRNLKLSIRALSFFSHRADKHTRTKGTKTRTGAKYKEARDSKALYTKEYRSTRLALISLGLPPNDPTLRPLEDKDTYRPSTIEPHEFGSGTKETGWIWTVSTGKSSISETDWEKEGEFYLVETCAINNEYRIDDRVQWFRMRAAVVRWKEEEELLEEELRRLIRGFTFMARVWGDIRGSETQGGRVAFASRQSFIYSSMAKNARSFHDRLRLTWSEDELPS